jgi:hypothetical protein
MFVKRIYVPESHTRCKVNSESSRWNSRKSSQNFVLVVSTCNRTG